MKKQIIHKIIGVKYTLDLDHPRLLLIDYNSNSGIIKYLNKRWSESEGGNLGQSKKKH